VQYRKRRGKREREYQTRNKEVEVLTNNVDCLTPCCAILSRVAVMSSP